MLPRSLRNGVTMMLWTMALIFVGCDQGPSFTESYEQTRKGADAVGPAGEDGTVPGGADDVVPAEDGGDGLDGGADGASVDGGEDTGQQDGGSTGEDGNADEAPVHDDGDDDGMDDGGSDATDGGGDSGDGNDGSGDGNDDGMNDGGEDGPDEIPTMTREMTFDSDNQGTGELRTLLDDPYIQQDITLVRNNVNKEKFFQQRSRPNVMDRFQQGHAPTPMEESFRQVADRPLDIAIVVDNSGSMKEEQAKLAEKLAPLLSSVADANWRIGVVSTDPNRRCLEGSTLNKGDANTDQKFQQLVSLGSNGSGNERGVLMAVRTLQGSCLNAPWIRNNSTLAVLIVSDEDNCSDGNGCGNNDYASGDYLMNYLSSIRTPGDNARIYGIFWDPADDQSACSTGYNKANIYKNLVTSTGGHSGSICDASYENTLEEISKNIGTILGTRFTLAYAPDPGTLEVFINDVQVTTGFSLTGKVLEFATPPMEDDVIKVRYGHGSKPVYSDFTLTRKVYGEPTSVKVNGVDAAVGSYSYDATTKTVSFAAPPADRAIIEVGYVEDIDLLTSFLLFDDVEVSTLEVDVDGVVVNNYTYNDLLRSVTFAEAPPAGSIITFKYMVEGPAVLNYPFAVENGPPMDLMAYDAFSGDPVGVSWANDTLSVNAGDFVEGRVITVSYDNLARQEFTVELPMDPVQGSIKASGGGYDCADPSAITVTGRMVNIKGCNFPDAANEVTVSFNYVIETYTSFTFAVDNLPKETDFQEWKVYIDGKKTNKYTRQGNIITLDEPAPPGSKIKITLKQYQ